MSEKPRGEIPRPLDLGELFPKSPVFRGGGTLYPQVAVRHPVVGQIQRYRDSGFGEFSTGRIMGLVRVLGERIEILAVIAVESGRGHFSAFLEELRGAYDEVVFWEVMNRRLERKLRRQGFVGLAGIEEGSVHTGLAWRRSDVDN